MENNERLISYGKGNVFAYRTYLSPLVGVTTIPESTFTGRDNTIFGLNVTVEVGGDAFLPSFSEGDNQMVVATDSMKNFIQRHLATFEGNNVEHFVRYVAESFLNTYDHIETVKLVGEVLPFESALTTIDGEINLSNLVFKRSRNERSQSVIELVRDQGAYQIKSQYSEVLDLQFVKVKDNSFVGFIRDEYTTLPEDGNRPLFVYLDIAWEYEQEADASGLHPHTYVASEQVRDLASTIFHQTSSPSIQRLIYEIGCRVLERFPQLQEVTFKSQNRTWDTVVEDIPGSEGKVYTEPRLPFGFQRFTVNQSDLQNHLKRKEAIKSI
ncbi:urate oxidase [Alkalihalobacillus sp. LMS6]|uniref:factor-independent urate hydroxylase n=1 Tax=Alkalihalobacillus sp. LMS6 TaxID=2924034 RepID=UPI0020D0DC46|nr:urate oxidase [Alkalihalobacillus sp. LMS6]UTR06762.1 urate oxidase [Alkalihalobacillus sp. LMS6]